VDETSTLITALLDCQHCLVHTSNRKLP